ncbi:hypothetical protein, partial [Burkholderia sp.]|uniref:hypothetical protein n=1 Tax=Burkholderia sp. TaxID=36773 RepID=UPI002589221F
SDVAGAAAIAFDIASTTPSPHAAFHTAPARRIARSRTIAVTDGAGFALFRMLASFVASPEKQAA